MYSSSSLVIFPLLIASTMAFPYGFPPFNYYPPPSQDTSYGAPPPPQDTYNNPTPHTHGAPPPPQDTYNPAPRPSSPGTTYGAPPPPQGPYNPAPSDPPPASDDQQAFLDGQNAARKAIDANLPPLVWNDTVAAYASKYAEERKVDCQLVHSHTDGLYGENIADGSDLTAEQAVGLWVDEKTNYDYSNNECSGECGHYTQVVWKQTTQTGCARVKCDSGGYFATCNYFPPGNIAGQRPY